MWFCLTISCYNARCVRGSVTRGSISLLKDYTTFALKIFQQSIFDKLMQHTLRCGYIFRSKGSFWERRSSLDLARLLPRSESKLRLRLCKAMWTTTELILRDIKSPNSICRQTGFCSRLSCCPSSRPWISLRRPSPTTARTSSPR